MINLLCLLGIHKWINNPQTAEVTETTIYISPLTKSCKYCNKIMPQDFQIENLTFIKYLKGMQAQLFNPFKNKYFFDK